MSYQAQVSGSRGFARAINRRDIHRAISRDKDAQIPGDEHDEHVPRCAKGSYVVVSYTFLGLNIGIK
jgi:hypothetical protein